MLDPFTKLALSTTLPTAKLGTADDASVASSGQCCLETQRQHTCDELGLSGPATGRFTA